MAGNNILRWSDGRGWLVMTGGVSDELRALALGRAAADGGIAYVAFGSNSAQTAEKTLDDMEDLGAPSGYLVDVLSEDDETVQSKIADASMIVISGESNIEDVRGAILGAAVIGMQAAFANGALILAEGINAMLMGAWIILEDDTRIPGLEWVESALIIPALTSISTSEQAKDVLNAEPMGIAIGIGATSALVLGPDGEIETWGDKQVTIALGRNYSA
jgi:hypothetical protein